jgi:hypothetical protein
VYEAVIQIVNDGSLVIVNIVCYSHTIGFPSFGGPSCDMVAREEISNGSREGEEAGRKSPFISSPAQQDKETPRSARTGRNIMSLFFFTPLGRSFNLCFYYVSKRCFHILHIVFYLFAISLFSIAINSSSPKVSLLWLIGMV